MFVEIWAQVRSLFFSPIFLGCIFSWFCAQFIKTIIKLFSGKVRSIGELLELLIWRTGGMPSSHSALVACLCTSIGFSSGINSDVFILSFCFYLITVRDALGVRRANGIQAGVLNKVGQVLKDNGFMEEYKKIKEVQGHTPLEVLVGSLLGFFVGIAFSVL